MDVDISGGPRHGRIYIAYLNRVGSSDYDIYIRHSDDQGESWSNARRINDDAFNNGRDQFHPWLTVDNTGVVTVIWLDRRHDPSNWEWHCYLTQSFDGGLSWTANQQVSTAPSNPGDAAAGETPEIDHEADRIATLAQGPKLPGPIRRAMARQAAGDDVRTGPHPDQEESRAGLLGEYIGIACYDGFATAVWTDTRQGHQDTYGGVQEILESVDAGSVGRAAANLNVSPYPAFGPLDLVYHVPIDGWVSLEIFDIEGRRIRTVVDRKLRGGDYRSVWDGTDQGGRKVASGSYWARFRTGRTDETATIVIKP
jgi:hypothetical protein